MRYESFNARELPEVLGWLEGKSDATVISLTYMNFDWVVVVDNKPQDKKIKPKETRHES